MDYSWTWKLLFHTHGYRFPTLEDGAGGGTGMAPLYCHVPLRKSKDSKNSKLELGLLDCYGDTVIKVREEHTLYIF